MDVHGAKCLSKHAKRLWNDGLLLDVALMCGNKTYFAHRFVITAFSSVLMKLLEVTTLTTSLDGNMVQVSFHHSITSMKTAKHCYIL